MQVPIALPAGTPSLRLLADQTAKVFAGGCHALNGLALLIGDSARPVPRRHGVLPCVPDWLPALVSAWRTFIAVGAVELFWIITQWPNGALAITFAEIGVLLFSPRADRQKPSAMSCSTVARSLISWGDAPSGARATSGRDSGGSLGEFLSSQSPFFVLRRYFPQFARRQIENKSTNDHSRRNPRV